MSNSKTTTTKAPIVENWSDFGHPVIYKGKEIVKANKSTAKPKPGAKIACHYINKKGAMGDWYYIEDIAVVNDEDKELLKSLNDQKKDLFKEYRQGNITIDAFAQRTKEIDETISKLQN